MLFDETLFDTPGAATFGSSPNLGSANPAPFSSLSKDNTTDWLPSTSSVNSLPATGSPSTNPITGTLGKVFDTFLDAAAVAGANKLIGTQYPTGQQSPQAVAAQNQAKTQVAANTELNWKPFAIAGGVGLVLLIGLAIVVRRK